MSDIDRTLGVPAYRQIADIFRRRIYKGRLAPGDLLPSETQLANDYRVARATVRQAIDLLRREGLVVTEQGKGSFVRDWSLWEYTPARHLTKRGKAPRATWRTEAERQDRVTVMEILGIHVEQEPPPAITEILGKPLVCRRKRELVDDKPIALYETWTGVGTAAGTALEEMSPVPNGLLDYLEEQIGLELTGFREHLSVRMPTPEEVSGLQLGDGVPVLVVRSVAYHRSPTAGERAPVLVDVKIIAGDSVEMVYELPAHES